LRESKTPENLQEKSSELSTGVPAHGSSDGSSDGSSENFEDPHGSSKLGPRQLSALSLAALGVVYGDIGTSPLYALRECFHGPHAIPPTEVSVLGVLSLVFWVLILVISIKYMAFVLRADNRGEGGILALTALAAPKSVRMHSFFLLGIGIFGAALLYGDGVITPAISVLSAVEGLGVATPIFSEWIIPITLGILVGLFWFQKHGTARIGAIFGPIMVVWFLVIGALGIRGIMMDPTVLRAVNPIHAWQFFVHHELDAYFVMGSLFLVVTGGEALYADMGHFGKTPIRWAWFCVVLPGLLLNYFGQGALLIHDVGAADNPFYHLAPQWALIPLVVLSTIAAVIASQALISGVFSLTRQAIQLGLCPRLQIIHTSSREIGQIYMPYVNWLLLIGTLWLVVTFKSSSNLAAAYGISVSMTMVLTTFLLYVVARKVWHTNLALVLILTTIFFAVDMVFFSANLIKFFQGGYVPLLIAAVIFTCMTTWRRGRQILAERLRESSMRLEDYWKQIKNSKLVRVPGLAIYMVGDPEMTPPAMLHNTQHNKVLHEKIVILTVITKDIPTVANVDRVKIEKLDKDFYKIVAKYGFIDIPDVMEIVDRLHEVGMKTQVQDMTFFLGRETLIATKRPGMAIWREHLFSFMSRNAQRATQFFNIPANQVIEVGIQVEL
jgi:KUP system potassium uptake protein